MKYIMFAKYNDNFYLYSANKREKVIITRKPEKADRDFKKEADSFYKYVSEDELTDVFSVKLLVDFNTSLPNVSPHWEVEFDDIDYVGGKILLRFSEGILPGWKTEEKNVCIKYIDINEVEDAKIMYLYKKRNAVVCIPPQRVENKILISEIANLCKQYKRSNV